MAEFDFEVQHHPGKLHGYVDTVSPTLQQLTVQDNQLYLVEHVGVDVLGLFPHTEARNHYILVVMDYFTKWAEAYMVPEQSVSSVRWVTVQSGGSVTIPCSYDKTYQQQVKYWCRGRDWSSCSPKVRTVSPKISNEMSISDNPTKPVFTVTINNLKSEDSGYYWCGVEISGGSAVGTPVYLSVTEGSPELSVDKQEMTGVEGDSVSVQCHSEYYYSLSWCRMGGSCITRSSGLDGRPVLIRVDRVKKVFIVTMRGLERKDTGWYWCDDNGYQQIPVHITVSQRTATKTSAERKY
ncbi:polymeric immunoglobulin receptor-like [Paramormyrops kingsleyae]|uniref:polymeric immunoglobulin receptor-like n=1 Tax=Paramormyrops kingsleyae TaxID=1676925 RepID=UPI003B972F24